MDKQIYKPTHISRHEPENVLKIIKTNQLKSHKSKKNNVGQGRNKNLLIFRKYRISPTKYMKMKMLAVKAHKENKIFSIHGNCKAIRDSLLERGWVEKIQPNPRGQVKRIHPDNTDKHVENLVLSSLLEKFLPKFIWYSNEKASNRIFDAHNSNTIINKLVQDGIWTTKHGLRAIIKNKYWFYIPDVAEVYTPRAYDASDEIQQFEDEYRITACTSLLKWLISMTNSIQDIFTQDGEMSLDLILFALNRCKEYIYRKQNKDIDQSIRTISSTKWNSFLKDCHLIISGQMEFRKNTNTCNKSKLYITYAKCFLREMLKYRPELNCEGFHNIWIIKPGHCCRGRGIKMASALPQLKNIMNTASTKYIVQKYIEEPLLIYDSKFDIRQYYLVTSTYPLVIWMYRNCYLKFSSQKYSLTNYDESIHLTNNAIQRKYRNSKSRHVDLPQNNMWNSEKFKEYLDSLGAKEAWEKIIYPGMRKSIVNVMLCSQDTLPMTKNRFELYGCDFLLDKEYKPWLIEVNSCPDLNSTTQVTAKICPAVLSDLIKVIVDYSNDPNASTGEFECIYRQNITTLKFANTTISVRGYSLPGGYFNKDREPITDGPSNVSA